jgi:anti-repressor protein
VDNICIIKNNNYLCGMEIIKIQTNDKNEQVVSARELHSFLGSKAQFTTWIATQTERAMLIENEDFVPYIQKSIGANGQPYDITDIALKLSAAKEISMLNGKEKGKQARLYFLECEKTVQNKQVAKLPTTYLEALKELVAKEEQIILLETKNEKLQLRSDFVDICFDTDGVFSMEETNKILKLGYGRNTMMKKLKELGILLKSSNTPNQKYINSKYFKVVETLIDSGKFKKLVSTTYVTSKGLGFIHKTLLEK